MTAQTVVRRLALAAGLGFALCCGPAYATATVGGELDAHCARQPAGAAVPQQSRPYRASGSSCALCHPNNNTGQFNTLGTNTRSCTSTSCPTSVNTACVNAVPTGTPTITAPAAGATVAANAPLTFSGSGGTDPDGFALTYHWTFNNGMPPASGASVTVTPAAAGTLTATLEVRDANGVAIAARPTRSVTVAAANAAPNGSIAPPASVSQGQAVVFQGSAADPDGDAVTYAWSFGPNATPASSTAQNPSVTFNAAGNVTVTLTVTDARGLTDPTPASATVLVNGPPNGSIAAPTGVVQNQPATFQGSATDPNNDLVTYLWNFGAGATPATSTAQNPAVTFSTTGSRTVMLTVTDSRGLADPTPASVTVNVTPPVATNEAPNGTIIAPAAIVQNQAASFQGSATDPNGDAVSYAWNFGAGATPATSTAQNPSVVFATTGARTVTLTVTDSRGLADPTPASVQVSVAAPANEAPDGSITPPVSIVQNQAVTFQGSASDPNGDAVTYAWNFGTGATPATSTAQNPSVTFSTTGTRTVTLTATDSRGLADPTPASVQVTVAAAPPPPAQCTDADRDGYSPDGGICGPRDCNDANAAINPGATEVCGDGIDNDCDGALDAADKECNGGDCLARFVARPVTITQASWGPDDGVNQLDVEGNQAQPGAAVTLFNAVTGALLGTTTVGSAGSDTGQWEFELDTNAPPCRVRVEINGARAERDVAGAPANCVGSTAPANRAPNGNIAAPSSIVQGQAVSFQGSGSDPDNHLPLAYQWSFGANATPNGSTLQNPQVTFNTAGSHTVALTVRDARGLADPTPATLTVTAAAPNLPPNGTIAAPGTIVQGQAVSFNGSASDPNGDAVSYAWSFGSSATPSTSTAQNPSVVFNGTGSFPVTLRVTDARGLADPTPATVTVTVVRPNLAPNGAILRPAAAVAINQGQSLTFNGSGSDPDGNIPISFAWDFAGGAPNSSLRDVTATFNAPGTYVVRLTVKDSLGLADPTPASVTVTVRAATQTLTISRAEWDDGELDVRGSGAPASATVTLRNAATGTVLATTRAGSTGTWRFERELSAVPCSVRVESGTRSGTRAVSDAPANCVR